MRQRDWFALGLTAGFANSMARYPGTCGVVGCLLGVVVLVFAASLAYLLVTQWWWVTAIAALLYFAYLKRYELLRMVIRAYEKMR